MSHLQPLPETEHTACAAALSRIYEAPTLEQFRSDLQAAHEFAIRRADAVCRSEPGVISKYALGEVIARIEHDQTLHSELGHFAESIALHRVLALLKPLIPVENTTNPQTAMNQDPTAYILAATFLSGSIGFFACALMASKAIRRANLEGWKEGVRFYQSREKQARETRL